MKTYYKGPHPDCHKTTVCGCNVAEDCPMHKGVFPSGSLISWTEFKAGEKALLDKHFSNASIVEVVEQTPQRMYTTVKDGEEKWTVMTYRLSKINNQHP